jgi:hypothetical protein
LNLLVRFARALVALVLIVLVVDTAPAATAGTDTGTNTFTETFDSAGWFQRWGLEDPPWHTTRRTDEGNEREHYLNVAFPAGSFNGASWSFPTGAADTVTLTYRIRFGTTWRPMLLQTGKLPGFGLPARNDANHCTEACGLKPVVTGHYSARASFDETNTGGSYVYTPPCATTKRLTGLNTRWTTAAPFVNGQWYTVRQRIDMNTPGQKDGRIRAWIDDRQVYDSGGAFCFRSADHPEVHVGTVWLEMYFGGKTPPPFPMWLDLDDISIEW